jgi:DNA polymerase
VSDDPDIRIAYDEYSRTPRSGPSGEKAIKEFHDKVFAWRSAEFFIANAVSCRPPDNRPPTPEEIKICWERLWNIIYIVDPLVIVCCGNSALTAVMGKMKAQITKMRGGIFDVDFRGKVGRIVYPVFPVFHPSYLLRKADFKQKGGDWEKTVADWRRIMRTLDFLRHAHYNTPIPPR